MAEPLDRGTDGALGCEVRLEELLLPAHEEAAQPRLRIEEELLDEIRLADRLIGALDRVVHAPQDETLGGEDRRQQRQQQERQDERAGEEAAEERRVDGRCGRHLWDGRGSRRRAVVRHPGRHRRGSPAVATTDREVIHRIDFGE
jgi:hypothetical protein